MEKPKRKKPIGSGRHKGVPNHVDPSMKLLQSTIITKITQTFIDDNDRVTPLELFLDAINNPDLPLAIRLDAAAKAAPYIHSKAPTQVEHSGKDGEPIEISYADARNSLEKFLLIEGEAEILEELSSDDD